MDTESGGATAADLLLELPEEELARIIFEYGEERNSRRIAKWIVEHREQGEPISTTTQLANLVARAAGKTKRWQIHPATRTFQALRIAVNQELEGLEPILSRQQLIFYNPTDASSLSVSIRLKIGS